MISSKKKTELYFKHYVSLCNSSFLLFLTFNLVLYKYLCSKTSCSQKRSNKIVNLYLLLFLPKKFLTHQHSLTGQENLKLSSASYSASNGQCETKAMFSPGGTGKLQHSVENREMPAGANSCEVTTDNPCLMLPSLLGCCNTSWRNPKQRSSARLPSSSHTAFSKALYYYKLASSQHKNT